ncbi:MAG: DUF3465 domain-containing protein [Methyloglobulus sp.]|nr:DUF3465 domain-containing protein [Methyloglobulus sp.]
MKKLFFKIFVFIILSTVTALLSTNRQTIGSNPSILQSPKTDLSDLASLKEAFENQQSNFQVKQTGRIVKILKKDNSGSRHQRFIVELTSGQKLLIAHNSDLAAEVDGLKEGEMISFYGEYEWNNKGGVVHWTHHDPRGSHPGGWLLYNNRKYD